MINEEKSIDTREPRSQKISLNVALDLTIFNLFTV
jgi:hypothetical protein